MGANFMTNSVKRNMISASDSHHLTTAAALAPMLVTASANMTEKTTIWSTSPSAIALIIETGERCAMRSPNDCGGVGGSAAVRPFATACAAAEDFWAATAASAAARLAASGLAAAA